MLGLLLPPALFSWLIAEFYNLKFKKRVAIPLKNSLFCGGIVFTSAYTLTIAAAITSFPLVMAFKSSNIIAILLVAVFCTRVRDKSLNLPRKKIFIGVIISFGVMVFSFFDPEIKNRGNKS